MPSVGVRGVSIAISGDVFVDLALRTLIGAAEVERASRPDAASATSVHAESRDAATMRRWAKQQARHVYFPQE